MWLCSSTKEICGENIDEHGLSLAPSVPQEVYREQHLRMPSSARSPGGQLCLPLHEDKLMKECCSLAPDDCDKALPTSVADNTQAELQQGKHFPSSE